MSGLVEGYNKRDFDTGPATYTDAVFFGKIIDGLQLNRLSKGAVVADLMSGPGKVGLAIQESFPNLQYVFVDFAEKQLEKIPNTENWRVGADVRDLPFAAYSLDRAVARYSIKDLTVNDQPQVLQQIYDSLKLGGIISIADMVSPSEQTKDWLNEQHSLKQVFSGRKPEVEGLCHIPTKQEWIQLLTEAGFKAEVGGYHMSFVSTTDWLKGKQVTEEQLCQLDDMILGAPVEAQEAFNIREEDGLVKIDYPVILLKGRK